MNNRHYKLTSPKRRDFIKAMTAACALSIQGNQCKAEKMDKLKNTEVSNVRVGGEIGRRIDMTIHNNLMKIDIENDFLQPFKERNRKSGYIGLGKLIDSLVRLAKYRQNDQLINLKNKVIRETIQTQESGGYIGLFLPEKRMWELWDLHEMSYIIFGLTTEYELFKNESALNAAVKLADYIIRCWQAEPDREPSDGFLTPDMASCGLELSFIALYDQTSNKKYLNFVIQDRALQQWDRQITIGRWGQIAGHAYAFLSRCLAQIRLGRLLSKNMLDQTEKVMNFMTQKDGMVITGTVSYHECWHDNQSGKKHLAETCATSYLIRDLHEMVKIKKDSKYGDIMERSIFNGLFAAQSPDGRKIRYYTPFDGTREYFTADTYCCPCNYRRIIANLPGMIYYKADKNITVNLYTPSDTTIDIGKTAVKIQQKTQYPSSDLIDILIDPENKINLAISLRIPAWCQKAKIKINNQLLSDAAESGTFFTIDRIWNPGDRISLKLPMTWRFIKGRKAQAGRIAVMRGPVVFCLNRERNEAIDEMDLSLITIDHTTLEGPFEDDTIRPGGKSCKVQAWGPGAWYPHAKKDLELTLTEFIDPNGEATYFNVPNPIHDDFINDELIK